MKLQTLLQDHQLFHSTFQQDYLITTKAGGTIYGQYKQSLRELYKRFRGLRETHYNDRNLQTRIKKLEYNLNNEKDKFKKEFLQIELDKNMWLQEESERVVTETKREFSRFYQQACTLKKMVGNLTPERRKQLDEEMWEYRIKEMVALDFVASGRLGRGTYEMINASSKKIKKTVLDIVKDKDKQTKLIEWYENKEDNYQIDYDNLPELSYNEDEILQLTT